MRDDVARIRDLIGDGKTNAEIMEILRAEQEEDDDLGWTNPKRTFKSLALTMRRAAREQRSVGASEVLVQLGLFRVLWEEAAASADVGKIEAGVLHLLREVGQGEDVARVFATLVDDMTTLAARPATMDAEARAVRQRIERRYLRRVDGKPVICVAGVASAIADASLLAFSELSADGRYRALFSADVLRPSVDLLIAQRPTWSELLRGVQVPASMLQEDGDVDEHSPSSSRPGA